MGSRGGEKDGLLSVAEIEARMLFQEEILALPALVHRRRSYPVQIVRQFLPAQSCELFLRKFRRHGDWCARHRVPQSTFFKTGVFRFAGQFKSPGLQAVGG